MRRKKQFLPDLAAIISGMLTGAVTDRDFLRG